MSARSTASSARPARRASSGRGGKGRGRTQRSRFARHAGVGALVLVLAGLVALVAVAIRGEPAPASRSERVHEIATTLRCPVCDDLSVADSPAPLAAQMRTQIDQQLAAGRSAEQIRQGFVAAYGDSVLLTPPHRGIGQVAYLLPVVVLTVGLVVAGVLLRGWRRRDPAATVAAPGEEGTDTGNRGDTGAEGNREADSDADGDADTRAAAGITVDRSGGRGDRNGRGGRDGRDDAALFAPSAADRGRLERALARLREEEP